jgi:hypothetical protein
MKPPAIFAYIETVQGSAPYGRVLDAGTGARSLNWLRTVTTDSITAVTATPEMAAQARRAVVPALRPHDRLLVGNWTDPELLAGERFDTVLAENLLGAVDGFAPFFQTAMFARLRKLTARRLYLAGMQPYVITRPDHPAGALIWEIGRYRDACLILAGEQPYREYPLAWVLSQLRGSGFRTIAGSKIRTAYKANFVNEQIDLCRSHLARLADQGLARSLVAHGDALRSRALDYIHDHGALNHGFTYVIAADPV